MVAATTLSQDSEENSSSVFHPKLRALTEAVNSYVDGQQAKWYAGLLGILFNQDL